MGAIPIQVIDPEYDLKLFVDKRNKKSMATRQNESPSEKTYSVVPRDPKKYRPSEHCVTQKKKRNVAGWIIKYLIENGDIFQLDDKRYCFKAQLTALDPEDNHMSERTDVWLMPVELTYDQLHETYHIVTTSPHIRGMYDDRLLSRINPFKPDGFEE